MGVTPLKCVEPFIYDFFEFVENGVDTGDGDPSDSVAVRGVPDKSEFVHTLPSGKIFGTITFIFFGTSANMSKSDFNGLSGAFPPRAGIAPRGACRRCHGLPVGPRGCGAIRAYSLSDSVGSRGFSGNRS